jgi:hypothetical protein
VEGEALLQRYPISREMTADQISAARRLTEAFVPRRDTAAAARNEN